jgi:flagellar hook-associated protein 1 FlgK
MSALMSLGTRAMMAAQAQLQTTGHNITNASVDGYSRQSAVLTTSAGQYTGAGYIGRGVDVSTVSRAVNGFLTAQVSDTGATAAADRTQADMLDQLQKVFGTGTEGLGYATTQLFAAWSDLASNPADLSARQVVLGRAGDLASASSNIADQLGALQTSATEQVQTGVDRVNELAGQVAKLNLQIAGGPGGNQSPNDLLDERDRLIDEISQYVQVTRVEQRSGDSATANGSGATAPRNGAVNLFIGGSQSLVLGSNAYSLSAAPDTTDPTKLALSIQVGSQTQTLNDTTLGGGSIAGLLTFRNDDLTAVKSRFDQLVTGLADDINAQQRCGVALGANPGDPVSDIFGIDGSGGLTLVLHDPKGLAAANPYVVTANAANTGTGSVASMSMTSQPVSSHAMKLEFTDNNGNYQLTDGLVPPVQVFQDSTVTGTPWSAGTPISYDGMSLTLAGKPVMGDSFDIAMTTNSADSNGNALAMVALGNRRVIDVDPLVPGSGANLADAYARILSDVGVRAQSAASSADVSESVAARAKSSLTSQTGVNLDEEAAKLIQYQQSYQAAAKILQVAQKVFDTVLGMAN